MSTNTKDMPKVPDAAFAVEEKPAEPIVSDGEFAAAEAEAKEPQADASLYVHKFKRPFTYEGHTFEELTFDFGALTGNDSLAIEDELQAMNKPVIVPTFSGPYLVRMAARACTTTFTDASGRQRRISEDVIRAMPIYDYNRIRGRARSFLLASEL